MVAEMIGKIYVHFFMKKHKDEIEKVQSGMRNEFFISDCLSVRMYAIVSKDTQRQIEENNNIFRKKVEDFAVNKAGLKGFDPNFWIYMASKQYPWIQSEWTKDQFYEYVHSLGSMWIPYADTGVRFFEKELPY